MQGIFEFRQANQFASAGLQANRSDSRLGMYEEPIDVGDDEVKYETGAEVRRAAGRPGVDAGRIARQPEQPAKKESGARGGAESDGRGNGFLIVTPRSKRTAHHGHHGRLREVMREGWLTAIKRFILWDYSRGSVPYDIMVVLILAKFGRTQTTTATSDS